MPTLETIPAHTRLTCRGCKWLSIQCGVRGRFTSTNHYTCVHPSQLKAGINGGEPIEYDAEQTPNTPPWCPIKDEVVKETIY